MSEKKSSLPDCLSLSAEVNAEERFELLLEALLPLFGATGEIVGKTDTAGAFFIVRSGKKEIYFSNESDLSANIFDWQAFTEVESLKKVLEVQLGDHETAYSLQSLYELTWRALSACALEENLVVTVQEESVLVVNQADGGVVLEIPELLLPLAYSDIQAQMKSLSFELPVLVSESFETFIDMLQQVAEDEFLGSLTVTAAAHSDEEIEVIYEDPKSHTDIVINFNKNDWKPYARRETLEHFLLESVGGSISIETLKEPQSADNYEAFATLIESVNEQEFQNAFELNTSSKAGVEVIYWGGKKKRKDKQIKIWFEASFWEKGLSRQALVDALTDQMKERLDDRTLEYRLFRQQFKTIASDYPELHYKEGLFNMRLVSADKKQCFFMGIRGQVIKALRPSPKVFCAENGYQYNEVDCLRMTTESAVRAFLEYDLGYSSPKSLQSFERKK